MRTVLIIDDSPSALKVATTVLEAAGYRVDAAINVAGLIACLARRAPDVVLVDVNMPELQGHDLVRYLRDVYRIGVPILLVSGMPEAELAELARRSNANGFVRKTSDVAAIAGAVEAALAAVRE